MNTPPTYSSATTSPRASPGGTTATSPQHASHDDKRHFLHEHSSCELLRSLSTTHSPTVSCVVDDTLVSNNEQYHSATASPHSSCSSRSSPSAKSHHSSSFSPSSPATAPFQGLVANLARMNTKSPVLASEARLSSRSRVRELSAPLPSAPPSTPASAIVHRASFSQSRNLSSIHEPSSLGLSPAPSCSAIFSSPLTEHCSDSEYAEQDEETSDSNSIEIISGYVEDSFVSGRFDIKESGNVSRGHLQLTHSSDSNVSPPKSQTPVVNANTLTRPSTSSSTTNTSQNSTPHPLIQMSSSPLYSADSSNVKLSNSISASSTSYHSYSKSPSPSRSQPRNGAYIESHLSSETSSPIRPDDSAAFEFVQEPHPGQQTISDQDADDNSRTPNVYINGLPPHFPDESLYVMTRDFGHVLSVRTFTRCVGEKMSGYGFVLFGSIDSAERCIETLRKYRNLHPSFSKDEQQVHKIPGTPYASGVITLPPVGSLPSLSTQPSLSSMSSFPSMASTLVSSASIANASASIKDRGHRTAESISTTSGSEFSGKDMPFREKMEKLKDARSTNLYMEGLPLTIDDVSLAALVSPHKIVSSRFFQTKLSDPPRMIAFVRLENRPAAEEVIERLHGRVVRGWNDNGCRISVRFADSNEQRELRRAERLARGEEEDVGGASRLSMAHAALLNLRGAEAQAQLNVNTIQQMQAPLRDLARTPANYQNNILASNIGSVAPDFGNIGSLRTLNTTRDFALKNTGVRSEPHHVSHHHRSVSVSAQQPHLRSVQTLDHFSPFGELDAHTANFDAAMTKRIASSGIHLPWSGGGLPSISKSIDTSRLALLQHQTQLQQLQLLQQMQNAASRPEWQSLDPSYSHALGQSQALMPSVDILTAQMNGTHSQAGENRLPTQNPSRGPQQLPRVQARSFSKASLSDLSSAATFHSPNMEHFHGHHAGNEDYLTRHEHHRVTNQHTNTRQQVSGYTPAHLTRTSANNSGELMSGAGRRHASILEEGEIANVSPALTYASRTPSTLSPATPLFNTFGFGTPASAPATVPLGKPSTREREHHRTYRNELR
ncbi:hypothetical protein EW145_g5589 [Phellinidium pouzarii]|uniref:RRM domain-containing protein n=1 Tax=Phellinidium pouzarii TaxID=167371 RepID=A0A4S4L022_9AGAM|nr:hypothetical protein EW145_g5589 [Phellinidium pouzarii]